jgi:uncharacterized protein
MDFRNIDKSYRTNQGGTTRVMATQYDEGLRAYMLRVYNYMAVALLLTGGIAFAASTSPQLMQLVHGTPLKWVVMLAPLGIVMYLSMRLQSLSLSQAQTWFWVFAGVMGLSLSYIFQAYTGASIARTFFVTSAAYGALSLYGYTTKKSLSGLGTFLFMGLIGIMLASLVNLFFQSPGVSFAVSALGVLIFAGLTAYDTQRIKETYSMMGANEHMAIMGALSLYLDFINLFIMLLRFIGDRR